MLASLSHHVFKFYINYTYIEKNWGNFNNSITSSKIKQKNYSSMLVALIYISIIEELLYL